MKDSGAGREPNLEGSDGRGSQSDRSHHERRPSRTNGDGGQSSAEFGPTLSGNEMSDGDQRDGPSDPVSTRRRSARSSVVDRRRSVPDYFYNLDEVALLNPVENPDERPIYVHRSLEDRHPSVSRTSHAKPADGSTPKVPHTPRRPSQPSMDRRRTVPDHFYNLDEVSLPSPVENPYERRICRHRSLEERLSNEERTRRATATDVSTSKEKDTERAADGETENDVPNPQGVFVSRAITELCTICHLTFFSILGTLARLGLEALTKYPGAPVAFTSLWVNFAGSLLFGFFAESSDRLNATRMEDRYADQGEEGSGSNSSRTMRDEEDRAGQTAEEQEEDDLPSQRQPSLLYVGLSVGFCGSFTTFSSFMRDVFLALSNNMTSPPPSRSIGDDFMAPLAVLIGTLFLCLAAIRVGAHIAILVSKVNWVLPGSYHFLLNRAMLAIGIGVWAGAIIMAAVPPDRPSGPASRGTWGEETWRGLVLFALVFAPVGCIVRFYLSSKLNGLQAGFPIGTFAANIIGTMVLGMAWDLQHSSAGSAHVGCQVLQGIMDGFCGCLTTVSTWVAELGSLRRKHAYVYGGVSLGVSLASLVVIMGSHLWSRGWMEPTCPVV